MFYRNPYNIEENLFVDISSPSSSKFASVEDLGSPAEAAQRMLSQASAAPSAASGGGDEATATRRSCPQAGHTDQFLAI